MMLAVRAGFTLGVSRLRPSRILLAALLTGCFAYAFAVALRRVGPLSAPDSFLVTVFAMGIPLLAYASVGEVLERAGLSAATWTVARYGLSRRSVALGLALAAWLASAFVAAPALALGLWAAYHRNPGFYPDCVVSLALAALGAAAYVGGFLLASTATRRGHVRSFVVLLDFVLGGGASVVASPWPRAHLASLLGGHPVMHLTQRQSSFVLALLAAGTVAWALARLRR